MNKDWHIEHIEGCDYCVGVDERKDLAEAKKQELIDRHVLDAYTSMVDRLHDEFKERQV